jgi:cystathionine beta-lyase/cystathionine gamma-synthase
MAAKNTTTNNQAPLREVSHGLYTRAVHAGQRNNPLTGAVVEPISQCSVYAQKSPGEFAYDYGRSMNPNFYPLEQALAALEYAEHATVVSSGVATMTALMTLMNPGDHVLIPTDLYGGTYRIFKQIFERFGVRFTQIDMLDLNGIEAALKGGVRMLYMESPTNPLMQIYDLEQLAALAKRYGALSAVDNTFATPICQNPIKLGCDIVLHSCSKYIGGHSDIVGGALMTNDGSIREQLAFARTAMGLHCDPMTMFLMRRGMKTLPLRVHRQQESALRFARHFESHPLVEQVIYPGLESHPQHDIAKKQMNGFGGMLSVLFAATVEETMRIVSSFQIFTLAESLGAVESLVQQPAMMSHAKIPKEIRERNGLKDGLIRISIGIEDVEDLIVDLERAIDQRHG